MQSYNHPRAMSTHGDTYNNRPMSAGPTYRSESRNFNPGGRCYPGDQRGQHFLQRRPSNYQLGRQLYGDDEEDLEYCRPRGSTIGDFDQDTFGGHRRRASFGGNIGGNNMYGSAYGPGMGMMSSSPREQMLRAQMMRGDLYAMDPMMGRMGLGAGYGSMYGGMGGYGVGPSMYGPGSVYGAGMMTRPRPMMGMGPVGMGGMGMGMGMGGMGMGMGMYGRPYRMSGLVETPSPHLTRAKSWSAYGRMF
ncbi:hypothetical protein PGTUg99_032604 [Puccinia graminis f. sp. tritici]|uniref:Uncharacterized protein n=2 Tax=Puccinia graminis f. sp. tritici TaxID=56615 RepID=H6QQP1_PUCGT|nr:uncharacterized protein PGTG_21224 [Puccinia graminis f. sp. tritici CRL 75-36-700-3]EHS62761.1 hypothetical protein PGTG_21224 [Puccinia graminis f. sp. tritici CRL 75-36-700-3]KAA1109716.1 hypothetical protein PGTUg99_032604 [Puccinia graminis f. sp. tritici]